MCEPTHIYCFLPMSRKGMRWPSEYKLHFERNNPFSCGKGVMGSGPLCYSVSSKLSLHLLGLSVFSASQMLYSGYNEIMHNATAFSDKARELL